jgi:hypothetical protein
LRGTGAAIGLPWLNAMSAAASTQPPAPKRIAAMYMPNGVHENMWTPETTGAGFTLSPTLSPLAPFQQDLLVVTNLWNPASKGGDGHYVKISGFLTCTTITKTLGVDLNCNGISMDQVAAASIRGQTPVPSLELAIAPVTTGVDRNVGYTRVYGSHLAWRGPTAPLSRELNPRLVFERLFRATRGQTGSARDDKPLLDLVLDDARQLRSQLGVADRARLDEYLDGVRAVEQRLDRASGTRSDWTPRAQLDPAARPEGIPKSHQDHVRLMFDMIALAFQTDTSRVATFLFANEVANTNFSFVDGVNSSHHELSHHENQADKLRQYQLINRWHIEQYAYLLAKLAAMPEGDSNVLANSMILFGAGIRDGNKHDPHNLPILVAGRAGGRLAAGQHLSFSPDTPLSNLYLAMLQAFGVIADRFADSTGPLPGVLT